MLGLGIFYGFRFWMLRHETLWLFRLDVYSGDDTANLVDVSLGRDGMVFLFLSCWLFSSFCRMQFRNRKAEPRLQDQEVEMS